jgi:acetyl esterase/lipase
MCQRELPPAAGRPAPRSPDRSQEGDRLGARPFFIAHGDHDTVVPVDNARRFADTLRGVSTNPVVYAELPGAQHAFDLFHSLRFETVVDGVEAFAAWVRSREMPQPGP